MDVKSLTHLLGIFFFLSSFPLAEWLSPSWRWYICINYDQIGGCLKPIYILWLRSVWATWDYLFQSLALLVPAFRELLDETTDTELTADACKAEHSCWSLDFSQEFPRNASAEWSILTKFLVVPWSEPCLAGDGGSFGRLWVLFTVHTYICNQIWSV